MILPRDRQSGVSWGALVDGCNGLRRRNVGSRSTVLDRRSAVNYISTLHPHAYSTVDREPTLVAAWLNWRV